MYSCMCHVTHCGCMLIAAATEAAVDVQEDANVETAEMQQARHQLPSAVSGSLIILESRALPLVNDCTIASACPHICTIAGQIGLLVPSVMIRQN